MNSQVPNFNSKNNQPQYNSQDCATQYHERQESSTALNDVNYVVQAPSFQFQPTVTNTHVQPVHPTTFFYRPPDDFYHYYAICKEISNDSVGDLLNKLLKENNIQPNGAARN
ncbi:hypothetical protein RclHR1_02370003 [Rhizophagus clarus]|uniref:Uncharacterized protein n=1 Tax=Rhizophagus clarus TaxID=94130 RepID=A0A2Z6QW24_9GLOM|nr:hypothetical protein RclHR1_02370003 [Rhizophagus clarus]GES78462.1 hypothetical protein GLOIN_2v1772812 [Rhizophagus clarus]